MTMKVMSVSMKIMDVTNFSQKDNSLSKVLFCLVIKNKIKEN